jgi:hypothetical protein
MQFMSHALSGCVPQCLLLLLTMRRGFPDIFWHITQVLQQYTGVQKDTTALAASSGEPPSMQVCCMSSCAACLAGSLHAN